jgi:glycosyltransferase involved in cell wall biosynthesis/protein-tyrosine-phosphatase
MRVCHVMSADLWAGAEVQVATMAAYLAERPDVELTTILLNEGPLARELRRLGVPVSVVDEGRNSAVRILVALTRLLRTQSVDIVHTHRYKDTVLGGLAARLAGVPGLVRTIHGQTEPMRGWARAKFRLYEGLDRLALASFADRIIAVSGRMSEGLQASGYGAATVVHIHNGVDLGKIRLTRARDQMRRELGVAPGAPLIGTVGRLSPVKGHAGFLRAARLILDEERDARFLLVGDGPLRGELLAAARRLGLESACLFTGPRLDVYDLVAAMDVFVLPSLNEGLPMALLEAMALGRPVVATAVGGVPEVVAHEATGLLVAVDDERAMADACLALTRDPVRAQALGARGWRRVQETFSHERCGLALVDTYRSLTGRAVRAERPLLHRVARRLRHAGPRAFARHRLQRARRDTRALVDALRSARRILILCQGNIIRSPFTARLLAQALGRDRGVVVTSAGLAAQPGTPPPPAAFSAAAGLDVDLDGHVASPVTGEAVAASDVIFVMDVPQLLELRRRFPEARAKAFLLTSLATDSPLEVRDPFAREAAAFRTCYEHISSSVRPIVRLLEGKGEGR